jgi:hypothetical protein
MTDEIVAYNLNSIKKKILEITTSKPVCSIRFKCEKAKSLSVPQNNKFWKACNKKRTVPSVMI